MGVCTTGDASVRSNSKMPARAEERRCGGISRLLRFRLGARHAAIATGLAWLLCGAAAASDWWVSPGGNDAASGSQAEPLASLREATSRAMPGDTVWIGAGTYFEFGIWLNQAADASQPIVLRAAPGVRPVVDGSLAPTGSTSPMFGITGSGYWIEGLEVRYGPRTAFSLQGAHAVVLRDNWIHHHRRGAIYAYDGAHSLWIEGNRIWRNVQVNNPPGGSGWPSALNLSDENDVVIDNHVFENFGEGIGAYGRGHLVRRNRLRDNFSVDLYANNLVDSTVEANLITGGDLAEFHRFGSGAVGLSLANEAPPEQDPNQFRNNRIVNNVVAGPRRRCLSQWNGYGGDPLLDSLIAHNTLACRAAERALHFDDAAHGGVVFRDNLVWQRQPDAELVRPPLDVSGIEFTRNAWFGGSGDVGTAAGVGDVLAEPSLREPDGHDLVHFEPLPLSPLRDAAAGLPDPATDALGRHRPYGSAADIGALEYVGDSVFLDGFERPPQPRAPEPERSRWAATLRPTA